MFDVMIIGSGPAGLTAGIFAARRELKSLIIGQEIGGQMVWASTIENYPGFVSIESFDLVNKIKDQVEKLGVPIKNEEVLRLEFAQNNFILTTSKGKYQSPALILAIGLSPKRLAIPGEKEFTGLGVSYCATCDAPLYRNKTVAVVGGGNAALDAALLLSKIAAKVYLIHYKPEFRAFEHLIENIKVEKKIELLMESQIMKITGDKVVSTITVVKKALAGQPPEELAVDGVFIEIGRVANTDLVADFVKRDERGQIIVDSDGQTSHAGIFAAGDVTSNRFKQIVIACGQGAVAALSAYNFLHKIK